MSVFGRGIIRSKHDRLPESAFLQDETEMQSYLRCYSLKSLICFPLHPFKSDRYVGRDIFFSDPVSLQGPTSC